MLRNPPPFYPKIEGWGGMLRNLSSKRIIFPNSTPFSTKIGWVSAGMAHYLPLFSRGFFLAYRVGMLRIMHLPEMASPLLFFSSITLFSPEGESNLLSINLFISILQTSLFPTHRITHWFDIRFSCNCYNAKIQNFCDVGMKY